jgi:hypothetical protein
MEAVNIAGQRPYAYLTHFFRVIVHLKGHYKQKVLRVFLKILSKAQTKIPFKIFKNRPSKM